MMPKPVCSRAEYERALREMEAYFEAEPADGSPEAERFNALLRMVEDFEAAHYAVECPGCGEIRLELQQSGEPGTDDQSSITEQVLAEFCRGCLSHIDAHSWQPPETRASIWSSTTSRNTPVQKDRGSR